MCGIVGIYNSQTPLADLTTAQTMTEAIAYRGPDAWGIKQLDNTTFAHRRLAIIDLDSTADQPMTAQNECCMITFNGEIYNFPALRGELINHGYCFRTRSDTEVILSLYETGGVDALKRLDGMFAFAIYDTRSRELILMRDRLGKKPLYYFQTADNEIIFASTLPALKKHPAWAGEINPAAVLDFLAYEYIPASGSIYQHVRQIPPATVMHFQSDGTCRSERYWQIDYSRKNGLNFADASALLREKIQTAVAKRLLADVPCGVFLSGGIDSAITAMTAAQQSTQKLSAFTIGFSEKKYDERYAASLTADWINSHTVAGVEHLTQMVDCRSFEVLKSLSAIYGEPFADFSMLPTYFLSKFASGKVKLVLSGDGADEIFGGYERYCAMRYCAAADKIIPRPLLSALSAAANAILPDRGKRSRLSRLCRLLHLAATPAGQRYAALMTLENEKFRASLCGERLQSILPHCSGKYIEKLLGAATAINPQEKCAECDLHSYLPGDILIKVDRASMANALEVRSPFLDQDLIEFAAALPFEYKQRGNQRKIILKHAMADCLAPATVNLPKRGFAVPLAQWFRGEWKNLLSEHLLEGKLTADDWIDRAFVEKIIAEHCTRRDHSEVLGALLMLELFFED